MLFDGVCNLCHASVRFIVRRDRGRRFRFASLQSPVADALLRDWVGERPDSVMLVEDGRVYAHSAAALRIVRQLNGLWPVCYALIAIPRPLRDFLYRFVARRRYRWFGRLDSCPLPDPALADRFLDAPEASPVIQPEP